MGRVPRWVVVVVAVAVLGGGVAALTVGHGQRPRPVLAGRTIAGAGTISPTCSAMVNMTSLKPGPGYRVEFGDVAVPPTVQRNPIIPDEPGVRRWAYAQRTGFMFLGSGPPAVISVPAGWQDSVALGTPNGAASSLHLPSCPEGAQWNIYVTVIYLHSPSACVPLRIQVGQRATTLRFDLGRACGS